MLHQYQGLGGLAGFERASVGHQSTKDGGEAEFLAYSDENRRDGVDVLYRLDGFDDLPRHRGLNHIVNSVGTLRARSDELRFVKRMFASI